MVSAVPVIPNIIRRLKTISSERVIPLTGSSLWAVHRAQQPRNSRAVFPRYVADGRLNANSASAALNKWLQAHIAPKLVVHSIRHSLRDRLRHVECPTDIVDAIGGWARNSVGDNYGRGHNAATRCKWLSMASVGIKYTKELKP